MHDFGEGEGQVVSYLRWLFKELNPIIKWEEVLSVVWKGFWKKNIWMKSFWRQLRALSWKLSLSMELSVRLFFKTRFVILEKSKRNITVEICPIWQSYILYGTVRAGVTRKVVFWLGIMVLTQISRPRIKQSKLSLFIPHIYVLGCKFFSWVLGIFGDK